MSKPKEIARFLSIFYIFCALFVCLLILYIQRRPLYIEFTPDDSHKLFDLNFKYVLNCGRCEPSISTVLIVTSYAGDFETRSAVRQAYPKAILSRLNITRVFLLALIDEAKNFNQVSQAALENEQGRYSDIVQGNFIEDYRNLTYKHVMGLKWVTENCSDVNYVVKMDHDIVFNLFELAAFLNKLPMREKVLAGYEMYNMKPQRDPVNKWFVTTNEYAYDVYPKFLSGWLYITNPYTANLLYDASKTVPYFWIDDTYVTGLVAQTINLQLVGLNKYYTTDPERLNCCMRDEKVSCPYWIGPNGGDSKMIIKFANHAAGCGESKCGEASASHCRVGYNRTIDKPAI